MNAGENTHQVKRPEIPTRLLVHALVREDGTVDAAELYAVAGILGMSDQQVRLCIKRLVAEGQFTHEGRGRRAQLRAVADSTGSIVPDADHLRHAYRQDLGIAPWDGTWHLFAFAIPESLRTARDALRGTLLYLGAAAVQGGLYVSANAIEDLVEAEARRLGVLDAVKFLTSTDLRMGGTGDPRDLAAAMWPLAEIAGRHERLAAFAESCLSELRNGKVEAGAERLTMAVELAAEFTRAMEPDPLLPPDLLPRPWPGSRARSLAQQCWAELRETAGDQDRDKPLPRLFRLYDAALSPADER